MTSLVGGIFSGTAQAAPTVPSGTAEDVHAVPSRTARAVQADRAGDASANGRGSTAHAVALGAYPLKRNAKAKGKDPGSLSELRRQAQQAFKGIEDANKALVARQKQFDASQKQLVAKLTQLQAATQALAKMRKPLSDLVESIYQDPSTTGLGPLFTQSDGTTTLRAMSDVDHLVAGRNTVLGDAIRLQQQQEQFATEAQELRAANLLQEAQLNLQIDSLRKRSSRLVRSLTKALTKLGVNVNQGHRGVGACDPTRVDIAAQYPNGLLPKTSLCPLPQEGEELRADAAIAFADLNLAYQRRFGRPICVSDSYRSLSEQQTVYYQRPGLAAIPGKSNHGLGMAVDLCGGVQAFRSVQFNWLEANSKRFGFIHPDWAYHSPFEPWHWEYDPKIGSLL
ncbi:D-alanyl-D-alanine carboxypeptidase family protein [Planotetraspora sp. GP83]|uniref:D-alanyl-D-alanine carboxypeptidase family protein n=1 Tax=Planotetraspora sp. GP83 TaxID=3156264 RepID=UPI0035193A0F